MFIVTTNNLIPMNNKKPHFKITHILSICLQKVTEGITSNVLDVSVCPHTVTCKCSCVSVMGLTEHYESGYRSQNTEFRILNILSPVS